jgi:hypothetical protein
MSKPTEYYLNTGYDTFQVLAIGLSYPKHPYKALQQWRLNPK